MKGKSVMKFKKIVAILLCIVLSGVFLTGCGSSLNHNTLKGTWSMAGAGNEITFSNGKYTCTYDGYTISGAYEIVDDRMILKHGNSSKVFLDLQDVKISDGMNMVWLDCTSGSTELSWIKK